MYALADRLDPATCWDWRWPSYAELALPGRHPWGVPLPASPPGRAALRGAQHDGMAVARPRRRRASASRSSMPATWRAEYPGTCVEGSSSGSPTATAEALGDRVGELAPRLTARSARPSTLSAPFLPRLSSIVPVACRGRPRRCTPRLRRARREPGLPRRDCGWTPTRYPPSDGALRTARRWSTPPTSTRDGYRPARREPEQALGSAR